MKYKFVTFSLWHERGHVFTAGWKFREIVTFLKWLKIVLINSRLLQNPCESYLYLFRKYVCIIPLVSSYLAWFRFVSENRIRRIIELLQRDTHALHRGTACLVFSADSQRRFQNRCPWHCEFFIQSASSAAVHFRLPEPDRKSTSRLGHVLPWVTSCLNKLLHSLYLFLSSSLHR